VVLEIVIEVQYEPQLLAQEQQTTALSHPRFRAVYKKIPPLRLATHKSLCSYQKN